MPKSKLLYYTDDSESEVEVEIENVKTCEENEPVKEPEPVNEVISVEPPPTPVIEPKKRGRKKKEEPKNQSWDEYIEDNIENRMPKYTCDACNKDFKRKHFLKRHLEEMRCSAIREKLKEEKNMLEEQKKQMEKPVKQVKEKPVKAVREKPVKEKPVKQVREKPVREKQVKEEEYIPPKPVMKRQTNEIPQGRPAITFRFA